MMNIYKVEDISAITDGVTGLEWAMHIFGLLAAKKLCLVIHGLT
jgi:hypothetical protein